MKLSQLSIKRIENNKTQKQVAEYCGIRQTMVSELESQSLLLMPEQMQKLLDCYNCTIDELYSNAVLQDIRATYRPKIETNKNIQEYYNFHVRLRHDTLSKLFTQENLRKCGYRDRTQWLYAKIKEFENELLKIERINNNTQ